MILKTDNADSMPQFHLTYLSSSVITNIVVHCNDGKCIRVNETNPLCEPLSFPIVYSVIGSDWKLNLPLSHRRPQLNENLDYMNKMVTLQEYSSFSLSCRSIRRESKPNGSLEVILLTGALFELFSVMAYRKIEKRYGTIVMYDSRISHAKKISQTLNGRNV